MPHTTCIMKCSTYIKYYIFKIFICCANYITATFVLHRLLSQPSTSWFFFFVRNKRVPVDMVKRYNIILGCLWVVIPGPGVMRSHGGKGSKTVVYVKKKYFSLKGRVTFIQSLLSGKLLHISSKLQWDEQENWEIDDEFLMGRDE